jgi:integrase
MRLTDASLKSLKAPEKGAVIYADDALAGFGVRVSQAGTKSYVLTHGVRRQRETIGRVGIITLHDARAEAKRLLAEHTLGKHRPTTISWNEALEKYLVYIRKKCRANTHREYKRALELHFRFGDTKLSDLSPFDLQRKIDKLADTKGEQQHAYGNLRAFLRWCHRRHYLDRNPMERMTPPHRYKPRERVLTNEELKRVWQALEDDTFGEIVRLLILSGQRVGETTKLQGRMVGEDRITLPGWLTKNGREHTFPLGNMAKAILTPKPDGDACFFPARGRRTPFNGHSPCKRKLDERCGVSGWTLHDLRRTFASGMASIGVQLPVIERLLNHVSGSFGGIVGVYQRYDFMPEMRDAILAWEARVRALCVE